jgi:hypothetical protein
MQWTGPTWKSSDPQDDEATISHIDQPKYGCPDFEVFGYCFFT